MLGTHGIELILYFMSFASIKSAQPSFPESIIVDIESDITGGLHAFSVVGLPDKAVEEAKDRISSAIKNSGFKSPKSKSEKITISLAPADLKKEGAHFDLPMALAYLISSGEVKFSTDKKMFIGELSLSGEVKPVKGILPFARSAKKYGVKEIFVPKANAREAGLVSGITIYAVSTLKQALEHLLGKINLVPEEPTVIEERNSTGTISIGDIYGQETAKRALLIASAGRHNICFYGPPGTGKTMLARATLGILPSLTEEEIMEVTSIHSISGSLNDSYITNPPMRAPHHTSSYVAVIGGGANPKPGEVTLAHRGILFLDEFPEFDRKVIDAMREPLEEGIVRISRARGSATFPARFMLIAAMNPCSCGYYGSKVKECTCLPSRREAYRKKISGPIADRIDLWVPVEHVEHDKLLSTNPNREVEEQLAKDKVKEARMRALPRLKAINVSYNSEIPGRHLKAHAMVSEEAEKVLNMSATRLLLSPRSYHKTLKVARTIADLEGKDEIGSEHVLEALQFRFKEI